MTNSQAKSEIDWAVVGRLIDAHHRAKQLDYVPGTSNWGAMLWSAIVQPVEVLLVQEPFGWWHQGETHEESEFYLASESGDVSCSKCIALFTSQQPVLQEPLTEAKIDAAFEQHKAAICLATGDIPAFRKAVARAIEAAHGIKPASEGDAA